MLTAFSSAKAEVCEGRWRENLGWMETAFWGPDPLLFGNRVEFTWFRALLPGSAASVSPGIMLETPSLGRHPELLKRNRQAAR